MQTMGKHAQLNTVLWIKPWSCEVAMQLYSCSSHYYLPTKALYYAIDATVYHLCAHHDTESQSLPFYCTH